MAYAIECSPKCARRGISLLEVLISMFIILIGLLGVAAMLPLGRLQMADGNMTDRGGALGRAALREMKTRGWLQQSKWAATKNGANLNGAVVIDPLGWSFNPVNVPANGDNSQFPPAPPSGDLPPGAIVPLIPRATLGSIGSSISLADGACRSQDDLVFTRSKTADFPPLQQWFGNGAKRMSNGDYSWFATVVPDPVLGNQGLVTVSVAVLHKRQPTNARINNVTYYNERTCEVKLMQGADVLLSKPDFVRGTVDLERYLTVKPGRWLIMAENPAGTTTVRRVNWYRVIGVDDIDEYHLDPNNPSAITRARFVTIAGQDWNITPANTIVILVDNVISVYEKNLRLESANNPWN